MPRFTISQIFMGTALIAIILTFTQTEGYGPPRTMIETLSFSSDDSRIVVSKLNDRTSMKGSWSSVSRTLSWINALDGTTSEIIHQDFKPSNCSPSYYWWCSGRTSALCNPSNDGVAMTAFGGGNITRNVDQDNPIMQSLQDPACNIAFSKSGRFLAASGIYDWTVFDTQNDTVALHVQARGLPALGASLLAFSDDETQVVVASDSGVRVWNIANGTNISTVIQGKNKWIRAIACAPDDTLIICENNYVTRYDFSGQVVATLANHHRSDLCCVSVDGSTLTVHGDGKVWIYSLTSNRLVITIPFDGVTALSLTSDGGAIAVGDFNGRVALVNCVTGNQYWSSTPPAWRHRSSWTLPAMFLVGWCFIAWQLSNRSQTGCKPS